ncbi:hypothetical protein KDH_49050 [Dictyobacter sp. S3.2.2.5]|uniref:Uncharacterized protein n=1 Tax=Dictyobacter halimunensis TaxID=3026934 RepID=A0ABQ6FZY6_9CHLR|nr:hypothetical protein KDH_49050 [Dictyobacter sp. S3.2.2.5]
MHVLSVKIVFINYYLCQNANSGACFEGHIDHVSTISLVDILNNVMLQPDIYEPVGSFDKPAIVGL